MPTWLIIAGARPNFMKVAPLMKAIAKHNAAGNPPPIQPVLVHTGQHYDEKMSEVFFRELGIPAPDVNLEVGSGSHAAQTANIMLRFEPVLTQHKPDWLIVVGDVNSTLACTLVASKLGVRVAHVEAGLRSHDRSMPEEINRIVTDALADLLLTPSEDANENLRREGVPDHKIRLVGNIMIDSLVDNLDQARRSPILRNLGVQPGKFVYVTLHRPANVDDKETLTTIVRELARVSQELPILFPVHPRTRQRLTAFGLDPLLNGGIRLLEPVGYHDSLHLTENARLVLTDSGGLQEESTYFRTPCLTLRPNTERPVTCTVGSNRLTNPARLPADFAATLANPAYRVGMLPPLWHGETAELCVAALIKPPPQTVPPPSS